jgi:hypothetical protein
VVSPQDATGFFVTPSSGLSGEAPLKNRQEAFSVTVRRTQSGWMADDPAEEVAPFPKSFAFDALDRPERSASVSEILSIAKRQE